jgi:ectoine hydroxylase-related dioxygenase (phytanoyl-CoA dioxygenase family)
MNHLTKEQIQAFERDGLVMVRGFYEDQEVAQISRWVDEIQAYPDAPNKYQRYYEDSLIAPGNRLLNRMENFSPYHEGFAQLFHESKLEGAISDLFGEPAVLFKEKINFKLPGGDGFKPHQDHQAGWWEYNTLCITALICIDEANEENGCLEIAPGKHKSGMFKEWAPLSEAEMEEMEFISCPTQPGDMILFDSFTPHGSKPNFTDKQRRLLFVTYNRLSEGDSREQYYKDKRKSYPQDCEREEGKDYVFRV